MPRIKRLSGKKRQIDAMWKEAKTPVSLLSDTAMVQAERALMEAHERDVTLGMNQALSRLSKLAAAAIAKSRAASLALAQAPTYGKLGG